MIYQQFLSILQYLKEYNILGARNGMAATRLPSSASSSGGGQGQQSHWRQNTDDIYGFRSNNQQGMKNFR